MAEYGPKIIYTLSIYNKYTITFIRSVKYETTGQSPKVDFNKTVSAT